MAFGLILLLLLITKTKAWFRSRKFSRQKNNSIKAEDKAARLLEENGFEIIAYQPSLTYQVLVNQEAYPIRITVDYLVKKEGFSFIAEVKSGLKNSDITNIHTRRQLLEYYLAYDVDGILLVEMVDKTINLIQFEF